jgi:hypothetical protein
MEERRTKSRIHGIPLGNRLTAEANEFPASNLTLVQIPEKLLREDAFSVEVSDSDSE